MSTEKKPNHQTWPACSFIAGVATQTPSRTRRFSAALGSAAAAPPPGPGLGEKTPRCRRQSGPLTAGKVCKKQSHCQNLLLPVSGGWFRGFLNLHLVNVPILLDRDLSELSPQRHRLVVMLLQLSKEVPGGVLQSFILLRFLVHSDINLIGKNREISQLNTVICWRKETVITSNKWWRGFSFSFSADPNFSKPAPSNPEIEDLVLSNLFSLSEDFLNIWVKSLTKLHAPVSKVVHPDDRVSKRFF